MPSENAAKRLPPDALDSFLDGILAELREPTDPIALKEIRTAFRKRVPLSLRSYAAAALIFRAAGLSRAPARPAPKETLAANLPRRGSKPAIREPRVPAREAKAKPEGKSKEAERVVPPPRPRFAGEGLTIFFSMGKRQRLYPRVLIDLMIDVAGLPPDSIGEVRAFDNYSFADIEPRKADALIAALNGHEFRGRKLSVGPAKKRDGQAVAE